MDTAPHAQEQKSIMIIHQGRESKKSKYVRVAVCITDIQIKTAVCSY